MLEIAIYLNGLGVDVIIRVDGDVLGEGRMEPVFEAGLAKCMTTFW